MVIDSDVPERGRAEVFRIAASIYDRLLFSEWTGVYVKRGVSVNLDDWKAVLPGSRLQLQYP